MMSSGFAVSALIVALVGCGAMLGGAGSSVWGAPFVTWLGIVVASAGWLGVVLGASVDLATLRGMLLWLVRRLAFWKSEQVDDAEVSKVFAPLKFHPYSIPAYKHTNSKGRDYYLHSRQGALKNNPVAPVYFFSCNIQHGWVQDVPEGYYVHETPSGMPVLKRVDV